MSYQEIIRAWKDEAYRASLSAAQQAQLPDNPAGLIELTDAELETVAGAGHTYIDCLTKPAYCVTLTLEVRPRY